MQHLAGVAFYLYTAIIILGGLAAVGSRSLVRALMGLIVTLFGVAGMYMLLAAPFVAIMQILIYVGAVAILIFFAIMLTLTPTGGEEYSSNPERKYLFAGLSALVPAAVLGWMWLKMPVQGAKLPAEISLEELGRGLMEPYILAFELISVVLLVAMSAAVILAFRRRQSR